MHVDTKHSFAFLVLAYNHQDYILEHLESIKYLVQTHGSAWDVDLIVNDDASRDQTRSLVDRWLALNATMFRHVKTLYNPKNLGTCASVNNMLTHMMADRCKLTAGDDVYSFENIFELAKCASDTAIIAARTIHLFDGKLSKDRLPNLLTAATEVIYKKDNPLTRFKHFSYINAPNLVYATECLMNANVRNHLCKYQVIEDWPLQIAIAKNYSNLKIASLNSVLVYYRRTLGSAYIIARSRFAMDKLMIFQDLIDCEHNLIERIRIKNRKFCFMITSPFLKKVLNLDFYIFVYLVLINLAEIIKSGWYFNEWDRHNDHYNLIKSRANFLKDTKTMFC